MQAVAKPITCSVCSAKYRIAASAEGSVVTCRRCGNRIPVGPRASTRATPRRRTTGRRAIGMRTRKTRLTPVQIASGVGLLLALVGAVALAL